MNNNQMQQQSQVNPFIPLQAARKSTKGKEKEVAVQSKPSKDVKQKVEEVKKQEAPPIAQTTNTQSVPQEQPQQIKEETKSGFQDTRKSRLAIKF
jgi:hypothetical protein